MLSIIWHLILYLARIYVLMLVQNVSLIALAGIQVKQQW